MCNLQCLNNGICREKTTTTTPTTPTTTTASTTTTYLQYCDCPRGTFGTYCEDHPHPCGYHYNFTSHSNSNNDDNFRYCRHDSTCMSHELKDQFDEDGFSMVVTWCDCNEVHLDDGSRRAYAGEECEYEATSYCVKGGLVQRESFCVNGGRCKRMVELGDSHGGCDCTPEYEGEYCEYPLNTMPPYLDEIQNDDQTQSVMNNTSSASELASNFIGLVMLVIFVGIIGHLVVQLRRVRRDKMLEKRRVVSAMDGSGGSGREDGRGDDRGGMVTGVVDEERRRHLEMI